GLIGEEEARLSVALSPENLSRATVHLATRSSPLLVSRSTDLEVDLKLIVPSVWRVDRAPSSIQVDQSLVRYEREASLEGSTLRIHKSCALSVGLIAPEGYADWVEAARDVDRADRIELVLTRPPQ
ncbi:MAG: hypothetical protein CL940_09750, partial [Deltaproteobacteria bacterium]|nr:hypothetical protein [Deltaproteobacteria bacterium]